MRLLDFLWWFVDLDKSSDQVTESKLKAIEPKNTSHVTGDDKDIDDSFEGIIEFDEFMD